MKQIFYLNILRKISTLAIIANNRTIIFGFDFVAEVKYFRIEGITYVSKNYYRKNIEKITTSEKWRGLNIEVIEKEEDLAYMLLVSRLSNTRDITVHCDLQSMNQALCPQCNGKGFTDWVEELIEHDWDSKRKPKDLDMMESILLKSFTKIDLHNSTVFYRNRNLKNEYIQECSLCCECDGTGFDNAFLETYFPEPIITHLSNIIQIVIGGRHEPSCSSSNTTYSITSTSSSYAPNASIS